ncbi:DUF3325 domain-containing protein [Pseudomonas sp. NPDC090202]|uniref:DUF3325 domain-containing protein n=1 Tax=unclassified Pseudomonas TaxID=196821 RepID=UPI0038238918
MLLATLLCYVGFTALCLSMGRHPVAALAGRERLLRWLGWSALPLSLWVALATAADVGMALIEWFAALMGSAVLLVFTMSYRPGLALSLAGLGALLCPLAAFFLLLA